MLISDEALLLARTNYGESSLVAVVLTARYGRLRVLAKGAYRATSRYSGVLDAFHTLELSWRPAVGEGLALLAAGDWLVRRTAIPRLGAAYRAAWSVLETSRLVARDGVPEQRLHALLTSTLDSLDHAARRDDERAARLARVAFDLAALHNLGLAPALVHCATCGRAAPVAKDESEVSAFAPSLGGRLCRACAARAVHDGTLLDLAARPTTDRTTGRTTARTDTRRGRAADAGLAPLGRPPARLLEFAQGLLERRPMVEHMPQDMPQDRAQSMARGQVLELERLVDRFTNHHLETERKSLTALR